MSEMSNLEKHIRLLGELSQLKADNQAYREVIEEIANYKAASMTDFTEARDIARDCISKAWEAHGEDDSRRNNDGEYYLPTAVREEERDSPMAGEPLEQVRLGGASESQAIHAGRITAQLGTD